MRRHPTIRAGSLRARRTVAGVGALLLAACTATQSYSAPRPGDLAGRQAERLQVERRDSSLVILLDATFTRDSVIGRREGEPDTVRTAIALSDVRRLDFPGVVSAPRTVGLVLGIVAAGLAVGFLVLLNAMSSPNY